MKTLRFASSIPLGSVIFRWSKPLANRFTSTCLLFNASASGALVFPLPGVRSMGAKTSNKMLKWPNFLPDLIYDMLIKSNKKRLTLHQPLYKFLLSDIILMLFRLTQKALCDLLPCGSPKLYGRLQFACVCENHVHSYGDECAAEMFSS